MKNYVNCITISDFTVHTEIRILIVFFTIRIPLQISSGYVHVGHIASKFVDVNIVPFTDTPLFSKLAKQTNISVNKKYKI